MNSSSSRSILIASLVFIILHLLFSLVIMAASFQFGEYNQSKLWLISVIVCLIIVILLSVALGR